MRRRRNLGKDREERRSRRRGALGTGRGGGGGEESAWSAVWEDEDEAAVRAATAAALVRHEAREAKKIGSGARRGSSTSTGSRGALGAQAGKNKKEQLKLVRRGARRRAIRRRLAGKIRGLRKEKVGR